MSNKITTGTNQALIFKGVFWATIIILSLFYVYAHYYSARLSVNSNGAVVVSDELAKKLTDLIPELAEGFESNAKQSIGDFHRRVTENVDMAFQPVYQQIPAYLDFHYSIAGEYSELAAGVSGHAGKNIYDILFVNSKFDIHLDDQMKKVKVYADLMLNDVLKQYESDLKEKLQLDKDELSALSTIVTLSTDDAQTRFTPLSLSARGGSLLVGGAIVKTITSKLALKLTTKVAVKTAAKTVGGGSGAATGAAAGLICGPFAWICVPVGAAGTAVAFWLLTDKAVIEADEYLSRDDFSEEITRIIDRERNQYINQVALMYAGYLRKIEDANDAALEKLTPAEYIKSS